MRKIHVIFVMGYLLPVTVGFNSSFVCLEAPFCSCQFQDVFLHAYCNKVVIFYPIYQFLRSWTAGIKIILNYCSLTTLPSHAFENVSIIEFASFCPLSDIPVDAFDEAVDLERIVLVYTTFTTIPRAVQNLRGLRTLIIRKHGLTSLHHELWNLQSLTSVSFHSGTLEELSEDVFARTPYIEDLNLANNRLLYIHPNTIKHLTLLRNFDLHGNQLLSVDGLLDNLNLEEFDISYNNLTNVDYIFNKHMLRLKKLGISGNPINSFAFLSREHVLPNLETIYMREINCSEIDSTFFLRLPQLLVVHLDFNRLQSVPKTLFRRTLYFAKLNNNAITSIKGLFDNSLLLLNQLDLSNNRIPDVSDSFRNLKNLASARLGNNDIERITNGDFEELEHLNFLNLSFNKIHLIESRSFSRLTSLSDLDLSGNCFKHLNRSLQDSPLIRLLIDSACLENIDSEDFSGLTKLSRLSLSNNNITSVDGMFRDLESIAVLNISGNKLTTLSRDTFPENLKLKELWLAEGNQMHCDCRLTWLIEYQAQLGRSLLQDNPLCHLPLRLRGIPVSDLTVRDLTEWPEDCPFSCRCECISQERTLYVRADCSYRNLVRIPNDFPKELRDLDLSGNDLESLNSLGYDISHDLISLNLENNQMTTLPTNIPQNLVNLRLAGNLMKRLPWSVLANESLEMLTLRDNPWICDCETVEFREWLLSMGDVVADVNDTKCGSSGPLPNLYGKVIVNLTDTDLCPSKIVRYVSLALGLLGTLLLSILGVLMFTRYHLYIKAWMYAQGHTWLKVNDSETEKRFDAFLSYHEEDEQFVETNIIPKLQEMKPKLTLCIPNRDIVCGVFLTLAHLEAIRESRRIIVILTQKYLNDAFCMSIFQQTYQQSLEDQVHRMILIKVDDIHKSEDMNPELVSILESTNYIPWQGKLFWERLYFALPKKVQRTVEHDNAHAIELI